jgi:uncharacterized membrane protein YdjX (TVP38/TMEM64 family)
MGCVNISSKKKIIFAAVFALVLSMGAFWFLFTQSGLKPEKIRDFIQSFGIWAPLIYATVYAQPIIPVPALLLTISGGLAFGPFWGLILVLFSATLRAVLEFLIARWLGREAVAKLLKGNFAKLDDLLASNSFYAVFLIRMIPNLPFDVQNYGLGLSKIPFKPYLFATFLGMLPGTAMFVYFGHALTEPQHIWKLFLVIGLIAVILIAQKIYRRKHPARNK